MTLGERLKKLRKDQGKTQQEIADCIGVAKSTYSLYESDKREPNVLTLKKIARSLHTTGDYLLSINNTDDASPIVIEPFAHAPSTPHDDETLRLLKLFQSLDEDSKKELLSYAEFKNKAYEDDPNLKDAEDIAADYIKECEDKRKEESEEKDTPDQPENAG